MIITTVMGMATGKTSKVAACVDGVVEREFGTIHTPVISVTPLLPWHVTA